MRKLTVQPSWSSAPPHILRYNRKAVFTFSKDQSRKNGWIYVWFWDTALIEEWVNENT